MIRAGGLYRRAKGAATSQLVERTGHQVQSEATTMPTAVAAAFEPAAGRPQGSYSPGPQAAFPAGGSPAAGRRRNKGV